jgi:hypothetical protein
MMSPPSKFGQQSASVRCCLLHHFQDSHLFEMISGLFEVISGLLEIISGLFEIISCLFEMISGQFEVISVYHVVGYLSPFGAIEWVKQNTEVDRGGK